jgi:hypothetical protein
LTRASDECDERSSTQGTAHLPIIVLMPPELSGFSVSWTSEVSLVMEVTTAASESPISQSLSWFDLGSAALCQGITTRDIQVLSLRSH